MIKWIPFVTSFWDLFLFRMCHTSAKGTKNRQKETIKLIFCGKKTGIEAVGTRSNALKFLIIFKFVVT